MIQKTQSKQSLPTTNKEKSFVKRALFPLQELLYNCFNLTNANYEMARLARNAISSSKHEEISSSLIFSDDTYPDNLNIINNYEMEVYKCRKIHGVNPGGNFINQFLSIPFYIITPFKLAVDSTNDGIKAIQRALLKTSKEPDSTWWGNTLRYTAIAAFALPRLILAPTSMAIEITRNLIYTPLAIAKGMYKGSIKLVEGIRNWIESSLSDQFEWMKEHKLATIGAILLTTGLIAGAVLAAPLAIPLIGSFIFANPVMVTIGATWLINETRKALTAHIDIKTGIPSETYTFKKMMSKAFITHPGEIGAAHKIERFFNRLLGPGKLSNKLAAIRNDWRYESAAHNAPYSRQKKNVKTAEEHQKDIKKLEERIVEAKRHLAAEKFTMIGLLIGKDGTTFPIKAETSYAEFKNKIKEGFEFACTRDQVAYNTLGFAGYQDNLKKILSEPTPTSTEAREHYVAALEKRLKELKENTDKFPGPSYLENRPVTTKLAMTRGEKDDSLLILQEKAAAEQAESKFARLRHVAEGSTIKIVPKDHPSNSRMISSGAASAGKSSGQDKITNVLYHDKIINKLGEYFENDEALINTAKDFIKNGYKKLIDLEDQIHEAKENEKESAKNDFKNYKKQLDAVKIKLEAKGYKIINNAVIDGDISRELDDTRGLTGDYGHAKGGSLVYDMDVAVQEKMKAGLEKSVEVAKKTPNKNGGQDVSLVDVTTMTNKNFFSANGNEYNKKYKKLKKDIDNNKYLNEKGTNSDIELVQISPWYKYLYRLIRGESTTEEVAIRKTEVVVFDTRASTVKTSRAATKATGQIREKGSHKLYESDAHDGQRKNGIQLQEQIVKYAKKEGVEIKSYTAKNEIVSNLVLDKNGYLVPTDASLYDQIESNNQLDHMCLNKATPGTVPKLTDANNEIVKFCGTKSDLQLANLLLMHINKDENYDAASKNFLQEKDEAFKIKYSDLLTKAYKKSENSRENITADKLMNLVRGEMINAPIVEVKRITADGHEKYLITSKPNNETINPPALSDKLKNSKITPEQRKNAEKIYQQELYKQAFAINNYITISKLTDNQDASMFTIKPKYKVILDEIIKNSPGIISNDDAKHINDENAQEYLGNILGEKLSDKVDIKFGGNEFKPYVIPLAEELDYHIRLKFNMLRRKANGNPQLITLIDEQEDKARKALNDAAINVSNAALVSASDPIVINKTLDGKRKDLSEYASLLFADAQNEIYKGQHEGKRPKLKKADYKSTPASENQLLHFNSQTGQLTRLSAVHETAHAKMRSDNTNHHLATVHVYRTNIEKPIYSPNHIRTPSIVTDGLEGEEQIREIVNKLNLLANDYTSGPITYNLFTSPKWGLSDPNSQHKNATYIMQAIHRYNIAHPGKQFNLLNLPVNGHGGSVASHDDFLLMADIALINVLIKNGSTQNEKLAEINKQYQLFINSIVRPATPSLANSEQGKEIRKLIEEFKKNTKPEATVEPPIKSQINNALTLIFCKNLHHQLEFGPLVQSLSMSLEDNALFGCKSGNERTAMIHGRVDVLLNLINNPNSQYDSNDFFTKLKEFITNPDEKSLRALDSELSNLYGKYELYAENQAHSMRDQGGPAKIFANTNGAYDTNYAERPELAKYQRSNNASILQAHNPKTKKRDDEAVKHSIKDLDGLIKHQKMLLSPDDAIRGKRSHAITSPSQTSTLTAVENPLAKNPGVSFEAAPSIHPRSDAIDATPEENNEQNKNQNSTPAPAGKAEHPEESQAEKTKNHVEQLVTFAKRASEINLRFKKREQHIQELLNDDKKLMEEFLSTLNENKKFDITETRHNVTPQDSSPILTNTSSSPAMTTTTNPKLAQSLGENTLIIDVKLGNDITYQKVFNDENTTYLPEIDPNDTQKTYNNMKYALIDAICHAEGEILLSDFKEEFITKFKQDPDILMALINRNTNIIANNNGNQQSIEFNQLPVSIKAHDLINNSSTTLIFDEVAINRVVVRTKDNPEDQILTKLKQEYGDTKQPMKFKF